MRNPVSIPRRFNLADAFLFDRLEEGSAERNAVIYGDLSYSYKQCARRAQAVAAHLAELGVRPQERVYIVLPDAPPFVWAFFGALGRGAVVAMGNPHGPAADLGAALVYTGATALITTPRVARDLAPQLVASNDMRAVLLVPDLATGHDPEVPVREPRGLGGARFAVQSLCDATLASPNPGSRRHLMRPDKDAPAIWLFTSGSTGRPKAAVHAQQDLLFNTEVYARRTVGFSADDLTLSAPRLFFGYATGTNLLFPFYVGGSTALFSERPTPQILASRIARHKPTIVTNVPTMIGKLLDHDEALRRDGAEGLELSGARFHLSAGEALPPVLAERFLRRFGCSVLDGIGSAEMFHIYCTNRPDDIRPGSLGKAVQGYQLKVLPPDAEGPGGEEVPRGETGVLWVRGDSVALGYAENRASSWQTFFGHWCRTNDLFRMDPDGTLWFVGRADERFKTSGVWVAPPEVERCLLEHPAVAQVAVLPVSIEGLTKPKAVVALRSGQGNDQENQDVVRALQDHVKARLAIHKYPRVVQFVDDLPKNDRGKLDRKAIAALYGDAVEQAESDGEARPGQHKARRVDRVVGLDRITTEELAEAVQHPGVKPLMLVPLGSLEPHGPHLPLSTDTLISQSVCERAALQLAEKRPDLLPLIAPPVPYGVTRCARTFSGAVSVKPPEFTGFLSALIQGMVDAGAHRVCLVNNHLEPDQYKAVLAAARPFGRRAVVACPLSRRWARTLSDEFKKGECHAGRYETSLVLVHRPDWVRQDLAATLPEVAVSLSEALRRGVDEFSAMGLARAYAGAPAEASVEHGREQLELLANMTVEEVLTSL